MHRENLLAVNKTVEMKGNNTHTISELMCLGFDNEERIGPMDHTAGIYILYYDTEVVYVGKSKNRLSRRIHTHAKSDKVFNRVRVYDDLTALDMHVLEVYLIACYSPKYNKDCKDEGPLRLRVDIPDECIFEVTEYEYWSKKAVGNLLGIEV